MGILRWAAAHSYLIECHASGGDHLTERPSGRCDVLPPRVIEGQRERQGVLPPRQRLRPVPAPSTHLSRLWLPPHPARARGRHTCVPLYMLHISAYSEKSPTRSGTQYRSIIKVGLLTWSYLEIALCKLTGSCSRLPITLRQTPSRARESICCCRVRSMS